ncbi:MAG: transcription antitermination factor NusB [Anaerolinea sp.]|nr:transcription antitermination factor NusB [Anaerolinea sp.]
MTDIPQDDLAQDAPLDARSLARRIALQILYEIDSTNHRPANVIAIHLQVQQPGDKPAKFVRELVIGVVENRTQIDGAIRRYASEYPLEQLAIVDRNVLRLAIYEFAISGRTPVGVAIDEAVELAKVFGADGTPSFVNGVLGALADDEAYLNELRQKEGDHDLPDQA